MIGFGLHGEIVLWSPTAEAVYGYTAEEASGRRAAVLLHTRFPQPLAEIAEELADLGRWSGTLINRAKDGREVAVESQWVAMRDDRGRVVGGSVTERPVELVPAVADGFERPGPVEPIAGELVHDLNNALAVIVNYLALIDVTLEHAAPEHAELRASIGGDLNEIGVAARKASELTQRLLTTLPRSVSAPPASADGASGPGST